jgi:hypothetical protein
MKRILMSLAVLALAVAGVQAKELTGKTASPAEINGVVVPQVGEVADGWREFDFHFDEYTEEEFPSCRMPLMTIFTDLFTLFNQQVQIVSYKVEGENLDIKFRAFAPENVQLVRKRKLLVMVAPDSSEHVWNMMDLHVAQADLYRNPNVVYLSTIVNPGMSSGNFIAALYYLELER